MNALTPRQRRMKRFSRVLALCAGLLGIIFAASSTARFDAQRLSPAPRGGWCFRQCALDAGAVRYLSFSFLGAKGVPGNVFYPDLASRISATWRKHFGLQLASFHIPSAGGRFELSVPLWPGIIFLATASLLCARSATT